jgi:predicted GNAT family acetyltransferase
MIMGEHERIDDFWAYYSAAGQEYRLACRELLFELRCPVEVRQAVPGLRLATPADLDLVMPVQAEMAFNESGINPMERDPEGFRRRCLRRIELRRTWVLVQDGELIFKAEVMADTPEAKYLEGIWVSPSHRGTSQGLRCMSQLARNLLLNSNSLCLLVNENNSQAHNFYKRAGYKLRSVYDSIFLK